MCQNDFFLFSDYVSEKKAFPLQNKKKVENQQIEYT